MNTKTIKLIFLLLVLCSSIKITAQPPEPGIPAGKFYLLQINNLPIVTLPYINNEELIAADTCASCGEAFGIDAISEFDFWEKAEMQIVNDTFDNVEIYRVKIKSPTAKALHVIVSYFKLNPNELLFIYSPNANNRILGAYSMHNNKLDSSFISNRIFDNEMILEINRRPKIPNAPKGILKIKKFIHVYKDRDEFEESLNCHENVICAPWYNDWCNQIRSVVKLYRHKTNDTRWWMCSGAVVNNLNNNFDPLILTANHCVENGDDHANWMVFFNFQSITCNSSTNGNDLMTVSGMDVIANDVDNSGCPDIALMRLREPIPLQYNAFYSGWNRRAWSSLPSDDRGIGIHHPAGDVKKISEGYRVNPLFSSCVKVNWTTGYTQGGSSGSPLFVTSREIIGVLSWGYHEVDACEDDANFFYSWLHKSWGALSPHLAPGNEEALTQVGNDPISACQTTINLNRRFFPGNDWQIKNQITIQSAQQVNVANITETTIEQSPFNVPAFNSDYIIRAGNHITIFPRFRINAPDRIVSSGIYTGSFTFGNQNRVSFQIAPCTPFVDDCGFNHENSFVVPTNQGNNGITSNNFNQSQIEKFGFRFSIYPNPTNGSLELNLKSENEFNKINIYDVFGKLIYTTLDVNGLKMYKIPISKFSKGVYFISVESVDERLSNQKIIVD